MGMVFLVYMKFPCVFEVERWLEVLCEYVACVFVCCNSPNPHFTIYVILTDCVMAYVD